MLGKKAPILEDGKTSGVMHQSSRKDVIALTNRFSDGGSEHATEAFEDDAFMVRAKFDAYDGAVITDPYMKVGLVLDGDGPVYSRTQHGTFEAAFRSGSLYSIMPGVHGELSSAPMQMLGLCIDMQQLDVAQFSISKPDEIEPISESIFTDETVQSVMLALWHTSNGSLYSSPFFREGVDIILNQLKISGKRTPVRNGTRKTNEAKIKRLHAYIMENLECQLSISDMALEAGVEESQVFVLCRQMTGMTPFTYLTHNRLNYAKNLLRQGASVTETALAVNYTNPSKFSAAFKRHFGQTPSQWRQIAGL